MPKLRSGGSSHSTAPNPLNDNDIEYFLCPNPRSLLTLELSNLPCRRAGDDENNSDNWKDIDNAIFDAL
jgi:hypothetical protein